MNLFLFRPAGFWATLFLWFVASFFGWICSSIKNIKITAEVIVSLFEKSKSLFLVPATEKRERKRKLFQKYRKFQNFCDLVLFSALRLDHRGLISAELLRILMLFIFVLWRVACVSNGQNRRKTRKKQETNYRN